MGSPKGAVDRIKETGQNAVQDIRTGAEQISQGQIERGATNIATGGYNLTPGGQLQAGAGMPVKGETALTKEAQAAANQAAQDAADAAAAAEADRKQKITDRLNEEIKLRARQPGRAQTLLTSGFTPSASNTNTLLTTAVNSMGR